jgi:hypothetical protein
MIDDLSRLAVEIADPPRLREGRTQILDVEGARGCANTLGDLPGDVVDEQSRLRRARQIARYPDHMLVRHPDLLE